MSRRIYINGRFLTQPASGVQRYATELVRALDRLLDSGELDADRFRFVLLAPRNAKSDLKLRRIRTVKFGHLTGHLWEQFELPVMALNGLLLNLGNTAPAVKHNQIVTIHDAAVFASPATYSWQFRTTYRILLRWLGRTSKIITVSDFSKSELSRYLRIPSEALSVIPEGKEHILEVPADEGILDKHGLREKPFVLAVSSLTPNKNFHSIVKAIEILGNADFDMAIAGGTSSIYSQAVKPLPDWVKHVGFVSDPELRALYEHAACFVYPSFYEGFGLPPLEAMTCGCPVIASNAASLPEVCGSAALYCDPHSPEDIAGKIRLLMDDDALQERLRQAGLKRATMYTWDNAAWLTAQVVKEALGD